MADLIQIQYEVVDKGKSLKTALTGVERMEKSLAKLSKEITSGTVTQDRQRKALIAYGRELKRLTGLTGTQAYGAVVKYKNALVNQTVAQNKAAVASQRLAKVQDYLASRQERATLATQKQNAALHQTKNRMNGSNMAVQQLGYQFGDFAVQVQGGTSAFVAFSQQASQLVGILPMVAGPLGLSMGAAVGLSAALGILIPIGSAVGRMFVEMGGSAESAAKDLDDLKKAIEDLESATDDVAEAMTLSLEGVFDGATEELQNLLRTYKEMKAEIAKEALAKSLMPLVNNISDMMDELVERKSSRQAVLDVGGDNLPKAVKDKIVQEMTAIAEMQVEAGKFLTGIQTALQGPSEKFAENMLKVSRAINSSDSSTQSMRDQIYQILSGSGMLVELQEDAAVAQKEEFDAYQRRIDQRFKSEQAVFNQSVSFSKATQALIDKNADSRVRDIEQRFKGEQQVFAQAVTISKATQALIDKNSAARKRDIDQRFKGEQQVFAQAVAVSNDLLQVLDEKAKKAAKAVKARFEAETFLFKVRFADEEALMSQPVALAKKTREKVLTNIQDTIAALRQQTDQETKLLGLTGERRTEEEIFYQLVQENAKADIKASKDKLRAIAKEIAAQKKANEVIQKGIDFAKDLSDTFTDFVMRGFDDFKGFVSSIGDMFKRLLAEMVSRALATNIFMPITAGFTGTMLGSAAGGATGSMIAAGAGGGGMLAGIGAAAAGVSSGFMGIMSGGGLGASFANLGGLMSGSVGGLGAIGAAIPAIAAVAVVIGLFTKKTKLLDSGLRTTVEGFDVAIETFKKTQTSSLFGLLKGSKVTAYETASAEVADPLIEAIGNMQQSIVDAAGTLDIGANAFDDFSYQFKLSLKGLTEEEQLQKINEEITKMGDSFASLTGHFETMNELLEAANQRMQLQNRLDQLLGNNQAILTRQREAELKAMHELNRPLAQAIYDLEDAQAAVAQANQVVANSFAALRASIDAEKERLQDSFASVLDGLKERLDVVNEALDQSRNIYDMLSNALSSRQVSGEAAFAGRRSSALSFLRGGDFSDERRLENALDVIAEPSEGLFSSFIDYARDFARTSITLEEAKKVAQVQLTAGEKQVLLLEEQIVASEANRDAQLDALDQQYQTMVDQYNALLGIDTSVKSVGEAIGTLRSAIESLASAQAASLAAANAAKAAAAVGTGGSSAGVQSASAAGAKVLEQLGQSGVATRASDGAQFKRINIRGSDQLLEVAKSLGIQTSGQTGAQLSQAISNAGNLGVNVDNATRAKQFAMGGYHTGGLRMVGERGPELEATGPSRIFSHNQTSGMFRDPDLKEAVNELRREVSGLRGEQRQMQATNAKYVKRNYDINRKWDVDGLPATRT